MDLKWNPGRVSRPASAAVRVTDLSRRGNLNPSPLIKDDGELLVDEYLSPRKLKVLTGVDDLQRVKALEMRVDTRENSLGNFGTSVVKDAEVCVAAGRSIEIKGGMFWKGASGLSAVDQYLQKEIQKRLHVLEGEVRGSISRDLGTTLSHLHILRMACCGLSDLDGISSCSSLKELYIAYNNISDLSQLTWLDHLEVLDAEGNNIEDVNQIQYLGLCCKLSRLTVKGNPICLKPNAESVEEPDYNYRAEVKRLIPHLEYLDEIPASQTALIPSEKTHERWLIIKESIKEGGLAGDVSWLDPSLVAVARQSGCAPRPPTTSRPGTTQWSANVGRYGTTRLLYGGGPLPDPTVPNELFPEDDSSDLTHGLSQVICGNPTKALRARRQKLGPPAVSPLKLCGPRMENLYGAGGRGDWHQEDAFSEPRVQREQHPRCLQTDQREKAAEALTVTLSDEEEGEDCRLTDSCGDELRETCDEDLIERISLDSSCHSCLSQSSSGSSRAQEGAVFSSLNHCLIPSPPKSPSPASVTDVAARPWKTRGRRVTRLKISSEEEDRQWKQRCQSRAHQETSAQPLGEQLALLSQHGTVAASGSRGQRQPAGTTGWQRPTSGPAAAGSTSVRPITGESPAGELSHHQPAVRSSTKASERFGLMDAAWPLTARAILRSLPDRPTAPTAAQNRSSRS